MNLERQPEVDEATVLMTYSSVIREGMNYPVPSRLSLLAALAAREYIGSNKIKLLIAGEQSYRDFPQTTGALLATSHKNLLPNNASVTLLPAGQNRLINTPYQVEALANYCEIEKIKQLQVVGWEFHSLRTIDLFEAYAPQISVDYISTESVLIRMAKNELQTELEMMGFEVDFKTILVNGIAQYAKRERLTRLAMIFDKKGQIIKALSWLRNAGRYDDLKPDGTAHMGLTDKPTWLASDSWYRWSWR